MKTIKTIKLNKMEFLPGDHDGSPWVADWRSFDIPKTVAQGIENAAPGLVAITLSIRGGIKMIQAAERAARKKGIIIIWWLGPRLTHEEGEILTKDSYVRHPDDE